MITKRLILAAGLLSFWAAAHEGHHHPRVEDSGKYSQKWRSYFENRLKSYPEDMTSLLKLGTYYLDLGHKSGHHHHFAKADHYFSRVLAIHGTHAAALSGKSRALMGGHQFHDALHWARQGAEANPNDQTFWTLLGDLHFALGHYTEAELHFNQVAGNHKDLASLARLAQIAEIRGDLKTASKLYLQAMQAAGQSAKSKQARAWCLTMMAELKVQMGTPDAAALFHQALELNPGQSYANWRLAMLAMNAGNTTKASRHINTALQLNPDSPAYRLTQAEILAATGYVSRATAIEEKAVSELEAEVARGELGHVRELVKHWVSKHIKLEKARDLALLDVNRIRGDVEAHELAAWTLYLTGNTAKAAAHMNYALRPGSNHPRLLLRAGLVYEQAGQVFKATHLYQLGLANSWQEDPTLKQCAKEKAAALKSSQSAFTKGFLQKSR